MRLSSILALAIFGAVAAAQCETRNDCSGDQVCCARCSGNVCLENVCVEPSDACCFNDLGIRGITSACDICSSPGIFDSPCD